MRKGWPGGTKTGTAGKESKMTTMREREQVPTLGDDELKGLVALKEKFAKKPRHLDRYVWGALRIGIGWIFLWGFLDKLFGFGFATAKESAWINGGSPTFGFLKFGTTGPFGGFYQSMATNEAIEWMFMLGLLFIGLPLMLGMGVRLAAAGGVAMETMMYTAGFILSEHNPVVEEHMMYGIIFLGLLLVGGGQYLGLGGW
jgi:thiosulfate dehydrogenase [quinone] large subunit